MITTVVFDLDDTLYDELDYCRSGFRAVARFLTRVVPLGCLDDVFTSIWTHFATGNRTRTFNAALDELGIAYDDRLIAQLVEVYRNHRPDIELPADSRRTLETLKATHTLALLTDGFLPAQRLKVQALGIEAWFKAIDYTEELGRACWKPSPAGFMRLLGILDVAPEHMVYVGDNETKDFIAPNQLGMLTVQLRRQARLHPAVAPPRAEATPRVRLDAIDQLPTLLVRY
jgi:putative hydrolase of the HAD superfamily